MRSKSEVGGHYGRWTMIEDRGLKALFRCDCGAEHERHKANILSGRSTQCRKCGFISQSAKKTDNYSEEWKRRVIYQMIRSGAKKEFSLSEEEVWEICQQNCFYCDSPPKNKRGSLVNPVLYSGIDRIDSSLGYSIDNIRPACWKCNSAKKEMSDAEFVSWISRAYEHLRGIGYVPESNATSE